MTEMKDVAETVDLDEIERQIQKFGKIIDYDVKEYPIEVIVNKYEPELEPRERQTEEGKVIYRPQEFIIPDYQRDYAWSDARASKFIESIFIGLPIPYMTFAESLDTDEGQLEIVDGSQRVRALARYLKNKFRLERLEKLTSLNGTYFKDLPIGRQRKFNRSTIRIIVLTEKADEEARRDLFERINTGSLQLQQMERRRGSKDELVIGFIEELAALPISTEMLKVSAANAKRREKEEFVLRFMAYSERYELFKKEVALFFDEYIDDKSNAWKNEEVKQKEQARIRKEYEATLNFVRKHFPNGFCREGKNTVARTRFEALAVGTNLALRERPRLKKVKLDWLTSDKFIRYTTSDGNNSRPRLTRRIEYVRNRLLGWEDNWEN